MSPAEVDALDRSLNLGHVHLTRPLVTGLIARIRKLEAIAEAAKAEVLAQGYRSTDMATALKAVYGEFWFETYLPPDGHHAGIVA